MSHVRLSPALAACALSDAEKSTLYQRGLIWDAPPPLHGNAGPRERDVPPMPVDPAEVAECAERWRIGRKNDRARIRRLQRG